MYSKHLPLIVSLAVLVAVLSVANTVHRAVQHAYQSEQRDEVLYRVSALRWRLEAAMNQRLHVAEALVPYVSDNPDIGVDEFEHLAQRLIGGLRGVRSIQLARDTVVSHVYPMAGNEAALGLDLLALESQAPAVRRALEMQGLVVAGPVNLVQGGRAFIARTPIFSSVNSPDHSKRYWGLATVLLDMDELFLETGVAGESHGLKIALKGRDGLGEQGTLFYGPQLSEADEFVETVVALPNGSWVMSALPVGGWKTLAPGTEIGWAFASIAAILMASFAYFLVHTPVRLRKEVDRATQALEAIQSDLEARVDQRTQELQTVNFALRERERRLAEAQRIGHIGNWVWHVDEEAVSWSDELYRIYNLESRLANPSYELMMQSVLPEDRIDVARAVQSAISDKSAFCVDHRIALEDGRLRSVRFQGEVDCEHAGQGLVLSGTLQDITERIEAESRLFKLAYYDSVTGLPNRALLKDRLEHALKTAQRTQNIVALVMLNLNRFKHVNDSLGHDVGDQLLMNVANRIGDCIRSDDTLARLSGDEFAIVLENITNADHIALILKKIFTVLDLPVSIDGHAPLFITACAGVSLFPGDGRDADDLLKHAGLALYKAKEAGHNSYHFFSSDLGIHAIRRMKLEHAMRKALDENQFLLYYQPLIDASTGQVCGFEALIRWQHPQNGLVSPMEFIPVAEDSGLIVPLGLWVMEEACRQHRQWQNLGLQPPPIHINLSAHQFKQEGLDRQLFALLDRYQLEPEDIGLEVTESVLMHDTAAVTQTLNNLKQGGFHISIDDFGTGHSSLSYLKRFDIDCLKIDRSFVRDITHDADDLAIVEAVILMAHKLGLKVVAEGIEEAEQLSMLCRQCCDVGQGYYFSPPMAAAAVPAYLQGNDSVEKLGAA